MRWRMEEGYDTYEDGAGTGASGAERMYELVRTYHFRSQASARHIATFARTLDFYAHHAVG